MRRLDPERLHVTYLPGVNGAGPSSPRRYTLTHSDLTGKLFLFIGADYDRVKLSQWYTRLMRDEVLAEWGLENADPCLMVPSMGTQVGPDALGVALIAEKLV